MKNYKKYNNNYDNESEERVQVTHATCNSKEEITDAIERTKKDLKNSEMPYGYQKINEEIITRVYKIPGNKNKYKRKYNSLNIKGKNNNIYKTYNKEKGKYFYSQCECEPRYEERYDCYSKYRTRNNVYNNKSPLRNYIYSDQIGTIYNFNNIAKNHGYYEGKTQSPNKINSYKKQINIYNRNNKSRNYYYDFNRDINNKNYFQTEYENNQKKYTNYTPINGGRIENYYENEISNDGKYLVSMTLSKRVMDEEEPQQGNNTDRNNYYRKKILINEIGGEEREREKKSTINSKITNLGDNYKYFERNENKSPLKVTETHQRRRQPYNVFKNEYYITTEEINKGKCYPIRTERETIRYYDNNNYEEDYNEEDEDYTNSKRSRKMPIHSMQFPSKLKKTEYNYYNY